jgi:putative SOS response-associated peptidase YedK
VCGRYVLATTPQSLAQRFQLALAPPAAPRAYNVAPQTIMPIITGSAPRRIEPMQWGLVPAWAKERTIGSRTINARAETVAERPAYRAAFRYRRCLVPASGLYEWARTAHGKVPYFIRLPREPLFAFAGLWESWYGPDGDELHTYTILTTTPNTLMAPIHVRMPVILPREAEGRWLDPAETRAADLLPLLQPYPAELMTAYPVSRAVNDPRSDGRALIAPGADARG